MLRKILFDIYIKVEKANNKDYEETDLDNLVYTVNPMPHSLLNYVFDFGSLSSQDEKRYIQNMAFIMMMIFQILIL